MLKYSIITIGVLLVIIIVGFFLIVGQGPDILKYEYLKTPTISSKSNQEVLLVKTNGTPDTTIGRAFNILFKTYFKLKGVPKHPMPTPRARWFADFNAPKDQWIGHFAVPVPDFVKEFPIIKDKSNLKVELVNWEYGEVAEILYKGSYESEMPAIEELKNFIIKSGYEITGPHEEEYLIGPSPYFPRNPKKFVTIIRYQVKKLN